MSKLLKLFKKKRFVIGAAVAVVVVVGGYFMFRTKAPVYTLAEAKKEDLTQEVSVTGKVKPSSSVDLAFDLSGRITSKNVGVGSRVGVGQTLASIFNQDIRSQLNGAEAALKSQQAKLDELNIGTRPEEILVYQTKVLSAQSSLADAQTSLKNTITDGELKSDDAIRNRTDQFFSNPRTSNPQISGITINDSQLKADLEASRVVMENILTSWSVSANSISADNIKTKLAEAKNNISQVSSFIDKISLAINTLAPSSTLSQSSIDAYKASVYAARANVSAAISALSAAEEKFKAAESALLLSQNELTLQQSGYTAEQIRAQEAAVEQAQASVSGYQAQLAKTYLASPIKGIVTNINVEVGQTATAGAPVVSVISENSFQIETDVPEADIAKIKLDNPARVTLDAYGDSVLFDAKVIKINPAETVIEGVSTYKVTLEFGQKDDRVKSGMTANIDIVTAQKSGVITIPKRAITEKNGNKFAQVLQKDGIVKESPVKVGVKGSNGNIEVTEGLNAGDQVIISTK